MYAAHSSDPTRRFLHAEHRRHARRAMYRIRAHRARRRRRRLVVREDMEGGDKEHRHAATSRRTTRGNGMHDVYDWGDTRAQSAAERT